VKKILIAAVMFTLLLMAGCTEKIDARPYPAGTSSTQSTHKGPKLTKEGSRAAESARNYLDMSGFSRKGLIKQLVFEGYSDQDAERAVDSLSADWNAQAARSAASYLELQSFSRSGLRKQLEYEGYTRKQAQYGVRKSY
jgi:uncharacterized protein YxeA